MCFPCSQCNKCGRIAQPGTCPNCGHVNGAGAMYCKECGTVFPLPPGVSMKDVKAAMEADAAGTGDAKASEAEGEAGAANAEGEAAAGSEHEAVA